MATAVEETPDINMDDIKLTLRFIILSQDAGGIIGKGGNTIRNMREESNALINVSGTAGVERILNVTGRVEEIQKAVSMVAEILEEVTTYATSGSHSQIPPVTMRLLVPNSQCGPVIGKGGATIKEIRQGSGATIMIPSETLPGCTERAVTLAGTPEALGFCVNKICSIFVEFPPRNNNVKFMPQIAGPMDMGTPAQLSLLTGQLSMTGLSRKNQQRVFLPSAIIGSLIGKGGCHINEVRQFSGANIQIEEVKGNVRRSAVTISGTPEAVSAAYFLINARIQASRQSRNRAPKQMPQVQQEQEQEQEIELEQEIE